MEIQLNNEESIQYMTQIFEKIDNKGLEDALKRIEELEKQLAVALKLQESTNESNS
jgi:hypothetical protein